MIKFRNGLTKFLLHETDMKIPIFNSIYFNESKNLKSNQLNFDKINDLKLKKVNKNQFESVKIINYFKKTKTLYMKQFL